MRGCKIAVAPERIAEGKQLYELTGTPVPDIAAMMGLSRRTLQRRVAELGWVLRAAPRHKTDRAEVAAAPVIAAVTTEPAAAVYDPVTPEARSALAAHIHNSVERSLKAVDRVLDKVGPAEESGAERSARTLAAVARALNEIAAITKPEEATPPNETEDDPVPRDIDEFRQELARRIRGFIEARRNGAGRLSGEPEGSLG